MKRGVPRAKAEKFTAYPGLVMAFLLPVSGRVGWEVGSVFRGRKKCKGHRVHARPVFVDFMQGLATHVCKAASKG